MSDTSIQVYQLVPASTLVELRDALERAIFANDVFIDQRERVFTVSPGGWLGFVDHSALWRQGDERALPQTRDEAVKAAEAFLDRVNGRTQAFNESARAQLRSLLPDRNQRQFESCSLVMRPDRSGVDHWLCRYAIRTIAGSTNAVTVPVFGMSLEVRIGAKGAVIAFTSQWRPFLRTIYADPHPYDRFSFLLKPHDDNDNGENEENPDAGKLLYAYDGAVGNQYYLAPYYYRIGDDHVQLSPASKYSLVVKLFDEDTADGTRLTAKVYGGSGAYAFNWAYWNAESAWQQEQRIVELGEGDVSRERDESGVTTQCVQDLPRTHATVMLNVTDQRTGAYRHFQQAVYSKPRTGTYGNV